MLTKRIIPCLDVKDNRVVKGVNFLNLRDAGDPVELGALYSDSGADELVFLDITATIRSRKTIVDMVKRVAENVFIPFLFFFYLFFFFFGGGGTPPPPSAAGGGGGGGESLGRGAVEK
jgi:hypothetical protein